MDWHLYFALVAATAVLMLIPGPNVGLIVANSVAHGTRSGLITVAGTSCAMVPQLLLTLLGMSAVLTVLSDWFNWLRWIGVAYLLYLGIKQWRAHDSDLLGLKAGQKPARAIYSRVPRVARQSQDSPLLRSILPAVRERSDDAVSQFALLAATFLVVGVFIDGSWALLAGRARPFLAKRGTVRHRVSGSLLIAAALGLALAREK